MQPLPDDFPFATAALIEPLAVCVRALNRLGPVQGNVLIFGDGPIGLLTTALLAHRGAGDITLVGWACATPEPCARVWRTLHRQPS